MNAWNYLSPILLLAGLLVMAVFSALQAAVLSISRSRLKRELEEHPGSRSLKLLDWKESPGLLLDGLLVGELLFLFASVGLLVDWSLRLVVDPILFWLLLILGFLLFLAVRLVAGTLGINRPLPMLRGGYPFLAGAQVLLAPLAQLFRRLGGRLFQPWPPNEPGEENEVRVLAEMREEVENLEHEEQEMIHSIFEFHERQVSEVMVPRVDLVALEGSTPVEEALRKMADTGHSRLPIYQDRLDQVSGVLLLKDALRASLEGKEQALARDLARAPFFVPESKNISELLAEMQRRKTQIALVVDEYGGFEGIVTLEDLLEEIVGEIRDEHDREIEPVQPLGPGLYLVVASLPLRELGELAGLDLSDENYDTVGGLLYGLFQHIPRAGEEIDFRGMHFRVEETQGNRILKLKVQIDRAEEETNGD